MAHSVHYALVWSQVDALMTALVRQRADDPTVKSVVVSQFTSFLTLLETPLRYSVNELD